MDRNQEFATSEADTFAAEIPSVLQAAQYADSDSESESKDGTFSVIISRAMEPQVINTLSSILESPIEDGDFDSLGIHQLAFYSIVSKLPFDQLHPYRPAIQKLMEFDISSYKSRSGHYAQTIHLINNARLLNRFIENPENVWVPENKFDKISYRSLWERVHTAEQMRPHMYGLFNWQVDQNHPPFRPCREQLARFPGTAAAVAAEVMKMAVNDTEHQHYLVDFVSECVPIGEDWLPMRAPVEEMVRSLEGKGKKDLEDGGEEEYLVAAEEWLAKLEKWKCNA